MQTIIKNYENNGNFANKPRSGQPPLLNDRMQRTIIRTVKENPKISAVEINCQVESYHGIKISTRTVRRCIKKNRLVSRVARKKPLLRPINVKKRWQYAKKYEKVHISNPIFWERVVFLNECKFMVFGEDGRPRVWGKPNEESLPQNINSTVKHGGGTLIVWSQVVLEL